MEIDFDTKLEHSEEVLFRELKGESVLLDLKGEFYYGLDSVGTRVWQLIGEFGRLEAVKARMLEEYDVSASELDQDLERIATELLAKGLLLIKESSESRS